MQIQQGAVGLTEISHERRRLGRHSTTQEAGSHRRLVGHRRPGKWKAMPG
uniref:Uncharacterized protein n=1 Tax=Arundo donax TaxID=35708 RepID=A0A0A9B7B2_ARUDO